MLAEFLGRAWAEAGPDSPGFAGATDAAMVELADPEVVRGILGRQGAHTVLALTLSGQVMGFASTRPRNGGYGVLELAGIVVARAAAGRGLGTRLVQRSVDVARRRGCRTMVVRTEPTNEVALAFYRARGFRDVGPVQEHVGHATLPLVELTLTL